MYLSFWNYAVFDKRFLLFFRCAWPAWSCNRALISTLQLNLPGEQWGLSGQWEGGARDIKRPLLLLLWYSVPQGHGIVICVMSRIVAPISVWVCWRFSILGPREATEGELSEWVSGLLDCLVWRESPTSSAIATYRRLLPPRTEYKQGMKSEPIRWRLQLHHGVLSSVL